MQQHQHIPIEDEEVETAEQAEEAQRLQDIFADMEKKQPDVLDDTAKSIIERIATFLAVLFAVTALGNNFPPKYLVGNFWDKALVIAILACYLVAMFLALWSLQPRNYSVYVFNRSRRQREWERLLRHKTTWTKAAGMLFVLGTVALALLVGLIILPL
jgi:uncharacterized membrane protein